MQQRYVAQYEWIIPEMNSLDPDLARPYSLKDILWLSWSAVDSRGPCGGLMAAEDCLSRAEEGLSK